MLLPLTLPRVSSVGVAGAPPRVTFEMVTVVRVVVLAATPHRPTKTLAPIVIFAAEPTGVKVFPSVEVKALNELPLRCSLRKIGLLPAAVVAALLPLSVVRRTNPMTLLV